MTRLPLELPKNARANLERTLQDLSDPDRQLRYKEQVPFVHVPLELLEQWSGHRRLLREQAWFRDVFDPEQLEQLQAFDRIVAEHEHALGRRTADVPEILESPAWQAIMRAATGLLRYL
jgi:hypothetical protein